MWRQVHRPVIVNVPEQWLVLVTCRDEKQQVELLERFGREGVECRALVSQDGLSREGCQPADCRFTITAESADLFGAPP